MEKGGCIHFPYYLYLHRLVILLPEGSSMQPPASCLSIPVYTCSTNGLHLIALCSVKPRCARAGKCVCVNVSLPLPWSSGLYDHLFKRVDHLGRCTRHVRFIVVCERFYESYLSLCFYRL